MAYQVAQIVLRCEDADESGHLGNNYSNPRIS